MGGEIIFGESCWFSRDLQDIYLLVPHYVDRQEGSLYSETIDQALCRFFFFSFQHFQLI